MPQRRDRTTGLPLPVPVDPGTTICVTLQIPNAPEYRQAFRGVLADLGKFWAWSQTQGESNEPAQAAAELWRKAAQTISYDCEEPMSCEDIADCIETSDDVQGAIGAAVIGSDVVNSYFNTTTTIGVPLLPSVSAGNLTSAAACDLDALFGAVTSIVDTLNKNNVDFLEQLEIESNTIERAQAIVAAVPLFETLPVDDFLGYIDTLMGEIKENYEAAVTTALIDEYRCDLFCLAQDEPDCALSFDMLISYFEGRLSASFEPATIFLDFVAFFTTGSWSGTQIVDVMILGQLAVWRAASSYLGLTIRTLQIVGALGANDPDPDWTLLCDECLPEELIPVIDSVWDPAHQSGFITGPDVDGFYTVTSQSDGTDQSFNIMDVSRRDFKLVDVTYSGPLQCQVMILDATPFVFWCGGTNVYVDQTMDEFWTTFQLSGGPQSMRFKMVAP